MKKNELQSSWGEGWIRRIKRRLKPLAFRLRPGLHPGRPVFILGSGRSGTSMLVDAFEHDMRIEVYKEGDARIARDFVLVRERVGPAIAASRASVVVMKPILDSFAVAELLDTHPTCKVIWMLRRFEDVTASSLNKFGTRVADDLFGIVCRRRSDSWLGRGIPADTLGCLHELETAAFGPREWMALVWWSVNRTLLLPDLPPNGRVLLVRYETLVREPNRSMLRIYKFIGLPFRSRSGASLRTTSIGKGAGIDLIPAVRGTCEELTAEIDRKWAQGGRLPATAEQGKPHGSKN